MNMYSRRSCWTLCAGRDRSCSTFSDPACNNWHILW